MKGPLRILNLEDNPDDAELNRHMLAARWPDCRLVRVETRESFVAALEREEFDVILSDFTMPRFDGWESLKLAREKCPDVPFLFVSGTIGEDTAIEALKNGATDYVLKHHAMRLIPAVDRALRERQERNERERAEEAMRQSEHKYRELFESLSDAAFLADEESGKIIDTNRSAERLVGCARADILGRKQSQFLSAHKSGSGANVTVAEAGPLQCAIIRADGTANPVEVSLTRLTLYNRPLVLRLCRTVATKQVGAIQGGG